MSYKDVRNVVYKKALEELLSNINSLSLDFYKEGSFIMNKKTMESLQEVFLMYEILSYYDNIGNPFEYLKEEEHTFGNVKTIVELEFRKEHNIA